MYRTELAFANPVDFTKFAKLYFHETFPVYGKFGILWSMTVLYIER